MEWDTEDEWEGTCSLEKYELDIEQAEREAEQLEAETWRAVEAALEQLAEVSGWYYIKGENEKAIAWAKRGVSLGAIDELDAIAVCYEEMGNLKEAIDWYKKEVSLGKIHAKLLEGSVSEEDREMYNQTIILEVASPQYKIGSCYEEMGKLKKAQKWYRKAAKLGDESARLVLDEFAQGTRESQSDKKSEIK